MLPTVPETPGHNSQPRVCRHSDADHILSGIVRRQAVGGLGADTGQAVRMGLRAAGYSRWSLTVFVVYLTYPPTTASSRAIEEVNCVIMARHLRYR